MLPPSADTLGAEGNQHLAKYLERSARSRLGIEPTFETPTVGRKLLHSVAVMPVRGIVCTDPTRALVARHHPGVQSVAASPVPQPRRLKIHLGQP